MTDWTTKAVREACVSSWAILGADFDTWLVQVKREAMVEALEEEVRWFTAALHNSATHGYTVQHREGFSWAVDWLNLHLKMTRDGTITYGVYTRRDGLEVRFREDRSQLDPDLRLRFDAYPARCGCYPTNTDWRDYTCPHGARWERLAMEPYGLPIEPEATDGD